MDMESGKRITGRVVKLVPFGAFVTIEGSELIGLVKIPEISWQRIRHPQDVLAVDQEIEAVILAVNLEAKQIILSIKRCQE